ncbi:putative DNA-binding domain-containing protein [Sphingobium phenoxybenzoativorans]|jgi:hypothetical protein|uniref:DUF2063 domain-containing protein n=2 Tax=Sphingobium TaxID=165695 RepID=A0A4Q1KN47_9SPHN|nr:MULTISPECIES: DNA-binding domain-containing protein [Sphingobium]QUT07599.1 putative DNA-binding domain-containing protein [Sphingobium phenoxybenzoativorans]RXR30870.1 DUF2063 domain-containing protein [Sphingobium fluviale]
MSLAALQQEFMGHVLDEERPLPRHWDARMGEGLAIYRNAYRTRLIDALRETSPKTALWVGDEAFAQAAAHRLILHPPQGWTLDLIGEGFVETLEELFAADPDVADLAWLEWAMHLAFTAPDCPPMDAAGFAEATSDFGEEDWATMRLAFMPSLHVRAVSRDCGALWRALEREEPPANAPLPESPMHCIVWREGLEPVFAQVPARDGNHLAAMRAGSSFGEICAALAEELPADQAAAEAGAMLGDWIGRGIVQGVSSGLPVAG